jgi:hypothetical protein
VCIAEFPTTLEFEPISPFVATNSFLKELVHNESYTKGFQRANATPILNSQFLIEN